jgi:Glycosyltransferase like family
MLKKLTLNDPYKLSVIRVICATKNSFEDFKKTNTGKSLMSLGSVTNAEIKIFTNNTRGLPDVYNQAIDEGYGSPTILVFIHDDVLVTDFFWGDRIRNSLKSFDILGVVGNRRRFENQPGWIMKDLDGNIDSNENLSGCIGQGDFFPPKKLDYFGPSNLECKLLDGVFLAAPSEVFHTHGLRFDPQFKFHFYDMDFCRSAEKLGLKMGTCDISMVHQSYGQLNQEWRQSYDLYLKKWGQ